MARNLGLDIMRAFSIWLVLLQHGGFTFVSLMPLNIGGIGVEVFFVLSGFLIGGILFREIDKGKSIKDTLKVFWMRRWFRILPLYYAVLIFKFIFLDHSPGLNILYYVFFLQNNFYGISFLSVSWSLVIEEWFYLFAPVFLLAITRLFKSENMIMLGMLAFIALVNVLRFFYVKYGDIPYGGVNSNFPFRFDSLFIGVLLAYMKHKKMQIYSVVNSASFCLAGLVLFLSYLLYFHSIASPVNLVNTFLFPRTLGFFVLPLSIGMTVPFIASLELNSQRNGGTKIFYWFITKTSILTYGLYLIHPFIFSFDYNFIVLIIITYVISWLVFTFFEEPILVYRDRLTANLTVQKKG